ncbi:MAG: porphobilinogen synthase [Actinobacteria bacterium]|nr:porphobilinogen synthase [Actinomycetota bacterium]MBU1495012.1 porphobilinogen synthase [Actinomycetota bacterium]
MRRMVAETRLDPSQLVLPMFVVAGEAVERPIPSMPGHAQMSVDVAVEVAADAAARGTGGVILFGIPEHKDDVGSSAWDPEGPVPRALRAMAEQVPGLVRWADVCLCEYTSHGHCGPLRGDTVDNDRTLPLLAQAAVAYAEAGADIVAPSDMMDGRVTALRAGLDAAGHEDIAICSYAVKYASAYYGPFRDAAESAPAFGDRRSYQMDPPNLREARREARLDLDEGADMLMVKPAGPYQDVIAEVRRLSDVPVAAYQVSGEFSMIEAAAERGWIDRERVLIESLTGITRAGADVILTYFALDAAALLQEV